MLPYNTMISQVPSATMQQACACLRRRPPPVQLFLNLKNYFGTLPGLVCNGETGI